MASKPKIQYIGEFYIHGSEAKVLAPKEQPKRKARLPKLRMEKLQCLYIDPFALTGMAAALVLTVVMVFGALQIGSAWDRYELWNERVGDLRQQNAALELEYRNGYNLEEVRTAALALGMVPVEELPTVNIQVTLPVAEPEPTAWEDFLWLLEGLFE